MKASSTKGPKGVSVLLFGDEPLVAEYRRVASSCGYEILSPGETKNLKGAATRASIALELSNVDLAAKKERLVALDKALPETTAILTSSVNVTVLDQSSWVSMRHRLIGIAAFPTLLEKDLVEIAPSVYTLDPAVAVAVRFLGSLKKKAAVVQDRVGMVMPRILCQVINETMFAVQDGTSSPGEIDLAMKLGAGYPLGPLEWGERVGFGQVYATLKALHDDLGEERYRICPLLKEIATTGKFWRDGSK